MDVGIAGLGEPEDVHDESPVHALRSKSALVVLLIALVGLVVVLVAMLLPGALTTPWKTAALALGVTLLTSSTISLVSEVYLRTQVVDLVVQRVAQVLPAQARVQGKGLEIFSENRVEVDFGRVWRTAQGHVRIIGFSANDVLSPQHMPVVRDRLKHDPDLRVSVLILNPWAGTSLVRASSPCYSSPQDYLRRVWAVMTEIRTTRRSCQDAGIAADRLQVRLYDQIPSLSCVFDDANALVTPTLHDRQGGASPYFVVRRTSRPDDLYQIYLSHFDALWTTGTDLDSDLSVIYRSTFQHETARAAGSPSNFEGWIRELNTWS